MFRKRSRKTREVQSELNITAFMNLMVVLIPFLLITAVFSQVSILKMNLPGSANNEQLKDDKIPMQLEVIIRKNRLVLAERNSGVLSEFFFENATQESPIVEDPAFVLLNEKLQAIKAQFDDISSITILSEPDTAYEIIIRSMDAVRMVPPAEGTAELPGELFPEVSIGSAPIDPTVDTAILSANKDQGGKR